MVKRSNSEYCMSYRICSGYESTTSMAATSMLAWLTVTVNLSLKWHFKTSEMKFDESGISCRICLKNRGVPVPQVHCFPSRIVLFKCVFWIFSVPSFWNSSISHAISDIKKIIRCSRASKSMSLRSPHNRPATSKRTWLLSPWEISHHLLHMLTTGPRDHFSLVSSKDDNSIYENTSYQTKSPWWNLQILD